MARPKPASRIPDWFNLDAYDRLSGLDANGWLTVVSGLRQLLDETPEFYRIDDEDAGVSLGELEATFISFQEDEGMGWADWKKQDYAVDKDAFNFGSVQSLSNWTVAHMGATLEHIRNGPELLAGIRTAVELESKREFKEARKALKAMESLDEFANTPFFVSLRDSREASGSGVGLPRRRTLSVNMRAPDEILRKDFDRWLQAMRALQGHQAAKKSFTDTDFKRWVRNAYVPLLVLNKWKELTGARITYGDLCEAAFPPMRRVEVDDVRKTFLPNAKAWASLETIDALAAQAAREDEKAEDFSY
ncbi:DUF6387 family protein [Stenotrophomonas sp. FR024]|uniref:DUF6387 family protein n=1 Tax=Stenotrophomonas sp. FR024 TaxID=3398460 RepID=UPI0039C6A60C